jgi:hypothetical protein
MFRAPILVSVAVNVATPVLLNVPMPKDVVPSVKLTCPVGKAAPVTPVTIAVNAAVPVTATVAWFAVAPVVEAANDTASANVTLVEARKLESPPYAAVSEWLPPANATAGKVAVPATSVAVPSEVVPS